MSDNFLLATESKPLLCSIRHIKKIAVFTLIVILKTLSVFKFRSSCLLKQHKQPLPSPPPLPVSLLFRIAISPILTLEDEAAE